MRLEDLGCRNLRQWESLCKSGIYVYRVNYICIHKHKIIFLLTLTILTSLRALNTQESNSRCFWYTTQRTYIRRVPLCVCSESSNSHNTKNLLFQEHINLRKILVTCFDRKSSGIAIAIIILLWKVSKLILIYTELLFTRI